MHCEKYPMHVYEVRPRKDKCGVDLISDVLPFGRLWHADIPIVLGLSVGLWLWHSPKK
jgi:hypothetical protein